jgi:hypothetical protein
MYGVEVRLRPRTIYYITFAILHSEGHGYFYLAGVASYIRTSTTLLRFPCGLTFQVLGVVIPHHPGCDTKY